MGLARRTSERAVDPEGDIAARIVFEVVPGEPAGERHLELAEVHADKATAAARIVLLIAERTAFQPER